MIHMTIQQFLREKDRIQEMTMTQRPLHVVPSMPELKDIGLYDDKPSKPETNVVDLPAPSPIAVLLDALSEGDVEAVREAPGSILLFTFFELRMMLEDETSNDADRVELALDVLSTEIDLRLKPLK